MNTATDTVRIWCIGGDGTEYYAAHSEEEMRQFYVWLVGKEDAERDMADHFSEVPQSAMDVEFDWDDDGKKIKTTWRKQVEGAHIPCQISTGYN